MRRVEPRAARLPAELRRSWRLLMEDDPEGAPRRTVIRARAEYLWRRDRWWRSLRRRLPSVDSVPLDRPIFLLGVQAGGLTIVARTLQRNEAVVTMAGNSSYWTAFNELGAEPNRMRRLPRSLWHCKFRDDIDHPPFAFTHNGAYACDELLPYYRRTAAAATEGDARAFKRVLREHIAVLAHDPHRARFLDKTQTYTVSVGYVDALLRGCEPHFVLVVRNPYAMVFSSMRPGWPVFRREVPREQWVEIAAQHWANSMRTALGDGERVEHFSVVRFEDFLADPAATVESICRFTGLDFDPDMLPQSHHRAPRGTWPGDYKWYPLFQDLRVPEVAPEEIAVIDRYCRDLAVRLGYEVPSPAPTGERLLT